LETSQELRSYESSDGGKKKSGLGEEKYQCKSVTEVRYIEFFFVKEKGIFLDNTKA